MKVVSIKQDDPELKQIAEVLAKDVSEGCEGFFAILVDRNKELFFYCGGLTENDLVYALAKAQSMVLQGEFSDD